MKYRVYKKIAALGVFALSLSGSAFAIDPNGLNFDANMIAESPNQKKSFMDMVADLNAFQAETKKMQEDEKKRQEAFQSSLSERDKEFANRIKELAAKVSTKEGLADLKEYLNRLSDDQKTRFGSVLKDVNTAVASFEVENKKADGITKQRNQLSGKADEISKKVADLEAQRQEALQTFTAALEALNEASTAGGSNLDNTAKVKSLNAQIEALSGKISTNNAMIKNNLLAKQRTKDASYDAKNAALKAEITASEASKAELEKQVAALGNSVSTGKDPQSAQADFDTANKNLIAKDRELKSVKKQKAALDAQIQKVSASLDATTKNVGQYQAQLMAMITKLTNIVTGIESVNPTDVPAVQPAQSDSADLNDLFKLEDQNAADQQNILSGDSSLIAAVPNESLAAPVVPNNSLAPDSSIIAEVPNESLAASTVPNSSLVDELNDFDAPASPANTVPLATMQNANQYINNIQNTYDSQKFDFKNPKDQLVAFKRCEMGVKLALNADSKARNTIAGFMNQNPQATGVARLGSSGGLDASSKSKLKLLIDMKNTSVNLADVRTQICGK